MTGQGGVKPVRDAAADEGAWLSLAARYEVAVYRETEIVRGRLAAGLDPHSPAVRRAVEAWPGPAYLDRGPDGTDFVLVRPPERAVRPRWWLHLLLFAATLFTTLMAGALMEGTDPLVSRLAEPWGVPLPLPTGLDWGALLSGAPFALPFMAILLAHEMGHYLMARRHQVAVTPPYFIPFPAYWSLVGTLGAFIRIRGPTVRRSVLFDVGAGGPAASFLLSVPVFAWGLTLSGPAPGGVEPLLPFVIPFAGHAVWLGDGMAVHVLAELVVGDAFGTAPVVLHPVAFAGWLGFFLTALNLLPMGQLDGGHVLYALSGRVQRVAGRLFLLALIPLGLLWWGWWLWAVAAYAVNRGRMTHPPVLQEEVPLDPLRRALAWACVVVFLLTFAPVPLGL